MSRYNLDHDPDELRSESVRKPQESSGDPEVFSLRGQGSSSGSAQEPPKQHTRHENLRDSSKVRRSKDVELERQPTYNLLDSELHTLSDLGAFRAINFGDLVQYRYNGNQDVTRRELNRLARAGFIRRQIISRTHSEQYTLTRLGRQQSKAIATRNLHKPCITASSNGAKPSMMQPFTSSTKKLATTSLAPEDKSRASCLILSSSGL
jgi:hypothetical protein